MVAFGDAGADHVHRELAKTLSLEDFREGPPFVNMGVQTVGKPLLREIGQIGGVKFLFERGVDFGDGEVLPGLLEGIKKPCDFL